MPILWFKSLSIWDQKIIKIPVIGDISVRQSILTGFGIFIDYLLLIKFGEMNKLMAIALFGLSLVFYMFAFWPVRSYPIEYVLFRAFFKPKIEEEELAHIERKDTVTITVINLDRVRPIFIRRIIGREHAGKGYEVRVGDLTISSGKVNEDGVIGFWFIPTRVGDIPIDIYVADQEDPVDIFTLRIASQLFGAEVNI